MPIQTGTDMIRLASVMACILVASCSQGTIQGTQMQTLGYAYPPPAFYPFCMEQPALCGTRGPKTVVSLSSERRAELERVNRRVNNSVRQTSDRSRTGRGDIWRIAWEEGDCNGIAIRKKHELMQLGWPASALLLTVAWSGREGHTVLTVRTDAGDLILDNLTSAIRDWSNTPYRYHARQAQFGGTKWEMIGSALPL
jgi:predicted transglutaminase-like cysteine proteinase